MTPIQDRIERLVDCKNELKHTIELMEKEIAVLEKLAKVES